MLRLFRAVVAFGLAAAVPLLAGCGENSKPAEPKITGGNVNPNLKMEGAGQQNGGKPAPAPSGKAGAPQNSSSAD